MIRFLALIFLTVASFNAYAGDRTGDCPQSLNVTKRLLNHDNEVNLCREYRGNVVLVVNTASKCGFTPQYEGLENLYRRYKNRGFVVLGFPSNDFGGQEPGSEEQIQKFCRLTYSIEFPMFEKTRVAQHSAGTLYRGLAAEAGEYPRWNFHKYLINRQGEVVASFPSAVDPESEQMVSAIESLL